ncbi:MAG: hypothetical protein J6Y77_07540 [Paludibacteraceae bacterium]|nr:hypothetical protein [Paludibacteraceae bacterium]
MKKWSLFIVVCLCLQSCGPVKLLPTNYVSNGSDDVRNYDKFYVIPTAPKVGGSTYYYNYGIGVGSTKSVNASDIISGYLMREGYTRVENINDQFPENTMLIGYGEIGVRSLGGLRGYTIEVSIQFSNANTHEKICMVTGEGIGPTEADDVHVAIFRCLDTIFHPERMSK